MKKVLTVAVVAMFVSAVVGIAADEVAKTPEKTDAAKSGCFSCGGCTKVSAVAGECCGKAMASCKVLSIKDGVCSGCSCAADCAKCGEVKDGKCACGKEVKNCDLTGKFVCEKCLVVAAKAGKCTKCSADLVEVKAKVEAKKEEAAK